MALTILEENPGYVMDTDRGIVVPMGMVANGTRFVHPFNENHSTILPGGNAVLDVPGVGVALRHQESTGIVYWPAYASGWDDYIMRAVTVGYLANASPSPVPVPLLSTIVSKIQNMVGTWMLTIRGKESPVARTRKIISQAQDSPFGSAIFIRDYMGALLVDNRGAIGAQVPIGTIEFDKWEGYGMEVEPVAGQDRIQGEAPTFYILRMSDEKFRENRGLWMVDGLTCSPTGNPEWPYWIQKRSASLKKDVWVLVHKDFGFQITSQIGPLNGKYPGYAQSPTWRFSPYVIKHFIIDKMDWEHLINQPMRGIFWVSGLDYPTQFRDQLTTFRQEKDKAGLRFYPGVFFGGSRGENSKVTSIPWSEPPAGLTPEVWWQMFLDALAACFHMNVTHLQLRLGEGAMTQSGVAAALESETAVSAWRDMINMIYNHIAPPRVIVHCIWKSDQTTRFQIESFREASLGFSRLNNPTYLKQTGEEPVYSREEMRAIIAEKIGFTAPTLEPGEVIVSDRDSDVPQALRPVSTIRQMVASGTVGNTLAFRPGNRVATAEGKSGHIHRWSGYSDWCWVETYNGRLLLMSAADLYLLSVAAEQQEEVAAPGDVLMTKMGTPIVVSRVQGGTIYGRYQWDSPLVDERIFLLDDLAL